jgi:hypothetical protein
MGGPVMGGRGSRGRALPQVGWENGIVAQPGTEHADPGGGESPTEQVGREPAPDRIRDAVAELLKGIGDRYVMISDVRAALSDLGRDDVDAALRELFSAPEVSIVPEPNQKVLTQQERDGAVRIGDQDKHLISIRKPLDPGARERVQASGATSATDADLAMAQRDPGTRSALYDEIRAEVRRRKATP